MARFKDREKALALRKQEMSYSQIKKILGVSKSTLSLWLRDYPLSKQRIRELRDCNEQRIERYRETRRKTREKRLKETYDIQKKLLLPLTKRELFIAGLFLYLGEGTKYRIFGLSVSNTDPSVIKFFIYWLNKILSVPKEKINVQLQLYNDMDIQKEINYWSTILKIPLKQFSKPYIKETSSKRINHKGSFGHGTCNVRINDVRLGEKIIMSIKTISDKYQ
ncbi:MAG: helix-turn-helix domain-containing protein [Patescibacteria group bacterium]